VYVKPVINGHTGLVPVIAPGWAGAAGLTVTFALAQMVVLQEPVARTKYSVLEPASGLTVILVPDPAGVPPQEPVNHSQTAPDPSEPPVTVSVLFVPKQVLLLVTEIPDGSVDRVPTLTGKIEAELVPHSFDAVTVIVPF
jgi:hypothetical protein